MRFGTRIGIGALLAATLSFGAAVPAAAGGYHHGGGYGHGWGGYRHHRGIGAGDVLLGAALIGGIAAIASAASQPRQPAYDNRYPPNDGDQNGYPQGGYQDEIAPEAVYDGRDEVAASDPVEQCSRAAERAAQQDGGLARVTGIDRVDNRREGARVRGTLEIDGDGGNDRTRFDCTAEFGRITGLRLG